MATINPIGYPFRNEIPQGSFILRDNDTSEIIYSGTAYPFPGESTAVIDVAEILRGYVPAPDYDKFFNTPFTSMNYAGFVHNISLESAGSTITDKFMWNYSAKSGHEFPTTGTALSKYPDTRVFNGMLLPCTSIYTDTRTIVLNSYSSSGAVSKHTEFQPINSALNVRFTAVKMNITSDAKVKYRFLTSENNKELSPYLESQGTCVPDNLYTLYYINMNGGIDFVHCSGTFKKKTNVKKNTFTSAPVIDNPSKHSMINYSTDTYNSYTLNTGLMNDQQSEAFQDIFKSPKVWLFDYKTNTFKAINITDTASDVKRMDLDHLFNYTISARDSQTYTINS